MNILEKQAAAKAAQAAPEDEFDSLEDPEDHPAYARAKELMLSKLYEEGAAQGLAQTLRSAPDPVQGVVDQVMALLEAVETATQGSVPDELVLPFTMEAITEVVEIAQESGMQITDADIAVVTREVLANLVEIMGGDATAIREEMASIDPGAIAEQAGAMPEEE